MKNYFITGACGFIGFNLSLRLLKNKNINIIAIDNLSRFGSSKNYNTLKKYKNFHFYKVDVSNLKKLEKIFQVHKPDILCHLAAQVAVTLSYSDPINDFNTNALGTLNLLFLAHKYNKNCYCLYSSTNKVYGNKNFTNPVNIKTLSEPYTPYGVSKHIGDLYFKEFSSKEFNLRTCVLKQSCIYGPNQFGIEDQGWLIWFLYKNIFNKKLNIYGNGKQIRDLLYIDDLIDLYLILIKKKVVGSYPVGGGIKNSLSLNEAIELIENITNHKYQEINYSNKRSGDQDFFVSDNNWAKYKGINWFPKISPSEGLKKMLYWIEGNKKLLSKIYDKKL